MTKEELYDVFNGNIPNLIHVGLVKEILDKFFDSNVVIPKGENRHPYAEVLHEWIEGAEVEFTHDEGADAWKPFSTSSIEKFRIKPEPVYEYKYALWYCSKKFTSDAYLTEGEFATLNTQHTAELLEETKRVRQ